MLIQQNTALAQTQRHDVANVFRFTNDLCLDVGFLDAICFYWIRKLSRIINNDLLPFCCISDKTNIGNCRDHCLIKLSFESFLDNLHVKHSKEAATKTKTKCL